MVCDADAAADMMANDANRQMMSIIILHNVVDMVIEERFRSGYYGDRKRVRGGRGSNQYYHSQQRRNRHGHKILFSRCMLRAKDSFLPAKSKESISILNFFEPKSRSRFLF